MDNKLAAWLRSHKLPEEESLRRSVFYYPYYLDSPYWIIDAEVEGLQYFSGYPGGEQLFISSSIPHAYREFVLTHEIYEFETRIEWPELCRSASYQEAKLFEIKFLNANERLAYWSFRVSFFRELVAYEERTNFGSERIEGFRLSLAFFEGLQNRDWPA